MELLSHHSNRPIVVIVYVLTDMVMEAGFPHLPVAFVVLPSLAIVLLSTFIAIVLVRSASKRGVKYNLSDMPA